MNKERKIKNIYDTTIKTAAKNADCIRWLFVGYMKLLFGGWAGMKLGKNTW